MIKKVFKYRGGDWGIVKRDLRSLANNELFAAPFASLNDPFEATVLIDHQSFEVGSLLLGWAIGAKSSQVKSASAEFENALAEFIKFTKGVGIYSLSKTARDELLWAHYANSHQGFCLEFDLERLLSYKLESDEVLEVQYSSKPPKVTLVELVASDRGKESLLKKLVATKSVRWKYEEEVRICVGKGGFREYDYRALTAIYFGVRCSRRLIRLAMRLLRGRGLTYYQMQLMENSYEMTVVEIEDDFPHAMPYRARIAPVDDGLPYLDKKTMPWEKELRVAIEMARREAYCERVTDAYIRGSKGTPDDPVFFVTYDRSDGLPRNIFYGLRDIQGHVLFS
jgi:hypothetical protein